MPFDYEIIISIAWSMNMMRLEVCHLIDLLLIFIVIAIPIPNLPIYLMHVGCWTLTFWTRSNKFWYNGACNLNATWPYTYQYGICILPSALPYKHCHTWLNAVPAHALLNMSEKPCRSSSRNIFVCFKQLEC